MDDAKEGLFSFTHTSLPFCALRYIVKRGDRVERDGKHQHSLLCTGVRQATQWPVSSSISAVSLGLRRGEPA